MKTKLILILKGMLLYTTILVVIIFISGVDSIYDNGYFIPSIIVCIALCYTSYKLISEDELETITLYKWFDKLIEKQLCE